MECLICKITTRKQREVCKQCNEFMDLIYRDRPEEKEETLDFFRNLEIQEEE